jgi:hypothetical protein
MVKWQVVLPHILTDHTACPQSDADELDAAVDLLVGKDEEAGRLQETVWTLEPKRIYTGWTSVSSADNFHLKAFTVKCMLLSDGKGEMWKENIGRDISNSKGKENNNIKRN